MGSGPWAGQCSLHWDTSPLPSNLVENMGESVSSSLGTGQAPCEAALAGLTLVYCDSPHCCPASVPTPHLSLLSLQAVP